MWRFCSLFPSLAMAWCILNSCHKVVRSIRNTTLKLCADCAKQFVRNAQNCGRINHGIRHNDNAPAHPSKLVREFLAKNKAVIMTQPPYSPELAPAAIFLFPKTEDADERKALCYDWGDKRKNRNRSCWRYQKPLTFSSSQSFATIEEVKEKSKQKLFQKCFEDWKNRC